MIPRRRWTGSKYGNRPTRCTEGVMHQSALEARRCSELHALQRSGLICELEAHPQPRLRLDVAGVHIADYRPDFHYRENGEDVYEDTKGHRTREYEIKRRLVLAIHGVEIREVRR